MGTQQEKAHWRAFGREAMRRLAEPLGHPTFIFSFIGLTLIFGGLGVWWEVLCRCCGFHRLGGTPPADSWGIVNAMTTYLVTLAAASLLDLVIRREEEGFRAFRVIIMLLGFLAMLAGVLGLIAEHMSMAAPCSVIGLVLSLLVWWIVNADNTLFLDDPPATAPTGGNLDGKVEGTLEGIKV